MMLALWSLGLLALAAWSALMWAAHAAWALLAELPWDQALAQMQALAWRDLLGPVLGPWFDAAWGDWLAALAPLVEWVGTLASGSAGWIDSIVVVALWVIWASGSAVLVAALIGGSLGLRWWRRRRVAQTAQVAA